MKGLNSETRGKCTRRLHFHIINETHRPDITSGCPLIQCSLEIFIYLYYSHRESRKLRIFSMFSNEGCDAGS